MDLHKAKPEVLKKIVADPKARRELARQSHAHFFAIYHHHYLKYPTARFHREFFRISESERTKLAVIMAFRGSAKSTIMAQSYPIWAIIGKLQKKYVLIASQTEKQARQTLVNIRTELEHNRLLKGDLGPFKQQDDEWGNATLVINKYGARITAVSTEQSIRGFRHGPHRPQLIICDDIEDIASAKTKEGRDKTFGWLNGELLPAGDTEGAKVVILGNLLHEDSVVMRLRERIERGTLDGVFRSYPLVRPSGRSNWPGRFPTKASIEAFKRQIPDHAAWLREYQLRIVPDDNQLIPREWIRRYDRLPDPDDGDTKFREVIVGIDPASSQSRYADYTAMVTARLYGYRDKLRVYILPHPVNARLTHMESLDEAERLDRAQKAGGRRPKIFAEDVGYQRAFVEQLKSRNLPAEGVKVGRQSKQERLAAVSHLVQSGKVLFPEQGAEDLITQLTSFGTEKHDDLADAFVMVLQRVVKVDTRGGSKTIVVTGSPDNIFRGLPDLVGRDSDFDDRPFTAGLMDKKF